MSAVEVRPFTTIDEFERVVDYFLNADEAYLRGMGVDPVLLPERDVWLASLVADLERDDRKKKTCYVAWIHNGVPVGHSNINKIVYGEEAFIHLHMWRPELRNSGIGAEFFKRSAQMFLDRFELKRLVCEPWAENPAPNRVLLKTGFTFVRRYRTVPGPIQREQEVNRYELAP